MSYAGERRIHDADSHVMETPGWLSGYADPVIRARLTEIDLNGTAPGQQSRRGQSTQMRDATRHDILLKFCYRLSLFYRTMPHVK